MEAEKEKKEEKEEEEKEEDREGCVINVIDELYRLVFLNIHAGAWLRAGARVCRENLFWLRRTYLLDYH